MIHSLLDAKTSTIRLHVVGPTWQPTLSSALDNVRSRYCRGMVLTFQAGVCCCRGLPLQGGSIVNCSLIYSLPNTKMSTVRLHIVGLT
jgi:hypothetical protein